MSRAPRVELAVATAVAVALLPSPADAGGRLRVRADVSLSALTLVDDGRTAQLAGALHDDGGGPVPAAELSIPLGDGVNARLVGPCTDGGPTHVEGRSLRTYTDVTGAFCVRAPSGAFPVGERVAYEGDALHSSSAALVPSPSARRAVELSFGEDALVASLDAPSFVVTVATRVVDSLRAVGGPLRIVLVQRAGAEPAAEQELATTEVSPGATARFDVDPRTLGGPGTGLLEARFAGSPDLGPAAAAVALERRARVDLSLARSPPPADPSEGVELLVGATCVAGAVDEGWVEALVDGRPAGMGRVSQGSAAVRATFFAPRGRSTRVALRFVPERPGLVPGEPVQVDVEVRAPSPWSGSPWLATVAAVGYWVVRTWLRPAHRRRPQHPDDPTRPAGEPVVELVETAPARSGWRGRVVDAHDGTPISGARISILVPVFDGEGVAASHVTADDGAFVLPHVRASRNDGARLVVAAPHHSTLTGPPPPDGLLSISLVSRRRAALERLTTWATRAGRPWAKGREPTPLEIAETAERRQRGEVAAWAVATAEAAYGPSPPDERAEQSLVAREPPISAPTEER